MQKNHSKILIEEIKSNLRRYHELIEKFVDKNQLSAEQKSAIFKSLNPPLVEDIISDFEHNNNVQLPVEYKLFLTEIGNGTGSTWDDAGIGPDLGILKVTFDKRHCFIFDDIITDLENTFQFEEEYNVENWEYLYEKFTNWFDKYTSEFRNELFQLREPTNEEFEEFLAINGENPRNEYYERFEVNGVLPICGIGCGEYYFIVISGNCKGEIWIDFRDNWGGVAPVLDKNGNRQKFDAWYNEWLTLEIEELQNRL